ncbi:MAG TPA: hypothetical protein PK782_05515, partial [Nitrospira sp.]|nr:hypothetical protein [Nitrospira sp.]
EYVDKKSGGQNTPSHASRQEFRTEKSRRHRDFLRDVDQRRTTQWNPTTGMADLTASGYGDRPLSEIALAAQARATRVERYCAPLYTGEEK